MNYRIILKTFIIAYLGTVNSSDAILYHLETLQSPDCKFALTMGSDWHLKNSGDQCFMDWQHVHEYMAAISKLKPATHAIALESKIFNEIEWDEPNGSISILSCTGKYEDTNRRTALFMQDFILTPAALAFNKMFGTRFSVPPINRGFLNNLSEQCLKDGIKKNFVDLDFRIIRQPKLPVDLFMNFINDFINNLKDRDAVYKILNEKDYQLTDILKTCVQSHAGKTMAEVYADTAKVYPINIQNTYDYKYLDGRLSSDKNTFFSLRELVAQVLAQLLDAHTILHIYECKTRGIKNLDLFMGGLHVQKISARLKAQGWKTVKQEYEHDCVGDYEYSWSKLRVPVSNVEKYFNALYEPQADGISFVGGVPIRLASVLPQRKFNTSPRNDLPNVCQEIGRYTMVSRLRDCDPDAMLIKTPVGQ